MIKKSQKTSREFESHRLQYCLRTFLGQCVVGIVKNISISAAYMVIIAPRLLGTLDSKAWVSKDTVVMI